MELYLAFFDNAYLIILAQSMSIDTLNDVANDHKLD